MPKPHRVVFDRVSGYADEAAAFMRRRRHERRPFVRVYRGDGSSVEHPADSGPGERISAAAERLIELAAAKAPR
jgi:hypothetical protein